MSHNGFREGQDLHMPDQSREKGGSNRRNQNRQNDRTGGGNQGRNKQGSTWRAPKPTIIDVDDDTQFPSITDSAPRKPRAPAPMIEPAPQQYPRPQHYVIPPGTYNYNRNRGRGHRFGGRGGNGNYIRRPMRYVAPQTIIPPPQYIPAPVNADIREIEEIDVLRQVEYYFSEPNLINDAYLRSKMDDIGFVDVALVHSFKRIMSFKISVEEFVDKIKDSEMLEFNQDYTKVRCAKDWERWVRFNEFLRVRQLTGTTDCSEPYIEFMRVNYGVTIIIQSTNNQGRPKPFIPIPYNGQPFQGYEINPLPPAAPFFQSFEAPMVYPVNSPYPVVYAAFSYDESFASDGYYNDQAFGSSYNRSYSQNAGNFNNIEGVTNKMGHLRFDEPPVPKDSTENKNQS